MLVYCKNELGRSDIGGKPIYGKRYCRGRFGPTEITNADYMGNAPTLERVPYTTEYLEEKYGTKFPPALSFNGWLDLRNCERQVIIETAWALGINWSPTRAHVNGDMEGLAQAICRRLSE
jgi:hypothetical protein